jgi:glutathione S-transferase
MKLYVSPYSGHCHRVRLLCGLLGIEPELEVVDTATGAQKSPEYLKINPFGQVPAMKEGDLVLRDSNAILLYLAEAYDADRDYLPADPVRRAHVYEWLATAAGPLYLGPARARRIRAFGGDEGHAEAVRVSEALLAVMEEHLASRTWLVDGGPTLADVACYAYIAVAGEGGVDTGPYANVRTWLQSVEALDGFVPMPRLPVR